ncbi:MAG: 2-isopropylmalate synthase [Acidobacteriota bacterium]
MTNESCRIEIFDTTLRDGEQCPGASLNQAEKLGVARQLARLRVDVIEAGFPAASRDDLAAVQAISEEIGGQPDITIAALARAQEKDIAAAWRGVAGAARPRIHTFLATSPLHMEHKLCMTPAQVLERVVAAVEQARELGAEVEFSPEDATRSDPAFLAEVLAAAVAAGARVLNLPDTVGYALPQDYGDLIATLREQIPAPAVTWSVHCHDDLGLATANSLAGIAAGARQAEVTLNGIGERAGNCALEELVMALRTRRDALPWHTTVVTEELARSSRLASQLTGFAVAPNKAVVGDNAFAHEAGIHQDGMLKHRQTYEIMTPQTVGRQRSELVLGKHSGRHAFRQRLEELGFHLEGRALDDAFARFKDLADRKKTLTAGDLEALAADEIGAPEGVFELVHLHVVCGQPETASATVRLRDREGTETAAAAVGPGPVDALFRAMGSLITPAARLADYRVLSSGAGADAVGEVSVHLHGADAEHRFSGYGADIDIVVATARALLSAFNRLLAATPARRKDPAATSSRVERSEAC